MLPLAPSQEYTIFPAEIKLDTLLETLGSLMDGKCLNPSYLTRSFHLFARLFENPELLSGYKGLVYDARMLFQIEKLVIGLDYIHRTGGINRLRDSWDHQEIDLVTMYYLSVIRLFFDSKVLDGIIPNQLQGETTKNLYLLLKESRGICIKNYLDHQLIQQINDDIMTNQNELEQLWSERPVILNKESILLYVKILRGLNLFGSDCRANLDIPSLKCHRVLAKWAQVLPQNQDLPAEDDLRLLKAFLQNIDYNSLRAKAMTLINLGENLDRFEDKFTYKEWMTLHYMNRLSKTEWGILGVGADPMLDLAARLKRVMKRDGRTMIRVCGVNTAKRLDFEYDRTDSIWNKTVIVIQKILSFLFDYGYMHINFLTFFEDKNCYELHGKEVGEGIYHDVMNGVPRVYLDEYDINVVPADLDRGTQREFVDLFFGKLKDIINVQNRPWTLSENRFNNVKYLLPSFTKTNPADVSLEGNEPREMSCGQFVSQALVSAHVWACNELGLDVPRDMRAYGFKENVNLERVTPTRVLESMSEGGMRMLNRAFNPL